MKHVLTLPNLLTLLMSYLSWNEQTISDFSDNTINHAYHNGYVFTRIKKGLMNQTRSLRIDLSKFNLSSENRRVLRKTDEIQFSLANLPYDNYHWSIGKMAKDFYTEKFGDGTFSANKVRELLTSEEGNFNRLFVYAVNEHNEIGNLKLEIGSCVVGYCITLETNELIHYSYPFYDLSVNVSNFGMGMMLRAIIYAKEHSKKYIYLGSFQRPSDVYKLQFVGLEWFDGERWSGDVEKLRDIYKKTPQK